MIGLIYFVFKIISALFLIILGIFLFMLSIIFRGVGYKLRR